jgi:hypothetical protein
MHELIDSCRPAGRLVCLPECLPACTDLTGTIAPDLITLPSLRVLELTANRLVRPSIGGVGRLNDDKGCVLCTVEAVLFISCQY